METNGQARQRSPRRKLSSEQELEVTRLYTETTTPVSEISRRFGIGEGSVYRVVERHGGQLRGRGAGAETGGTTGGRAGAGTGGASGGGRRAARAAGGRGRGGARAASSAGGQRGRGRQGGRQAAGRGARTRGAETAASGGGRARFRVTFRGSQVIEANDVRDALRQAEAQGAVDVVEVTRVD